MDIIGDLPIELKNNIFYYYAEHPIAKLFKERVIFDRAFVFFKMKRGEGKGGACHFCSKGYNFFGKVIVFKYYIEDRVIHGKYNYNC